MGRLSWEVLQDLQIIRCGEMALSLASSLVWNGSFVPRSCEEFCHGSTPLLQTLCTNCAWAARFPSLKQE